MVLRPYTLALVEHPNELTHTLGSEFQKRPTDHVYAIVDAAKAETLLPKLMKVAPSSSMSLFARLDKPSLNEAGPWLVEFPNTGIPIQLTCEAAIYQAAALWLQSPHGFHELAELLASRIEAKLIRGPEVLLRYYDPHVFSNLVPILKSDQVLFLSVASCWYWLDHAFRLCVLETLPGKAAADSFCLPLEINPEQESVLIDGGLPYEIMGILEKEVPGCLDSIPANDRYHTIESAIAAPLAQGQRRLTELIEACLSLIESHLPPSNGKASA